MGLRKERAILHIKERLINEAPREFAVMWGHHPAIGEPFLDDSCIVQTTAGRVKVMEFHRNGLWERGEFEFPLVPNRRTGQLEDITRIRPRETGSVDVVSFWDLKEGWYGLTNQRRRVGFGMAWDKRLFQCLWMWQVYGGHDDYPWYGRTYNVALEPFTSWPPAGVANAVNNGTALVLKPNEVVETDLVAVAYEAEGIQGIERDGTVRLA